MNFFMNFINMCVTFKLKEAHVMEVSIVCNGVTPQKLEYITMVVMTLLFELSSTCSQTMVMKVIAIKCGYHFSNW
jgi:hypothetical protein